MKVVVQMNDLLKGYGAEKVMVLLGTYLLKKGYRSYYLVNSVTNTDKNIKLGSIKGNVCQLTTLASYIYKNIFTREKNIYLINRQINAYLRIIYSINDPMVNFYLKKIFNYIKPSILHIHKLLTFSFSPLFLSKELGIPTIVTIHHHWPICPHGLLVKTSNLEICNERSWNNCNKYCFSHIFNINKVMERTRKILNSYVDRFVAVSNYVKQRMEDFGYSSKKIKVIYNGVATWKFKNELSNYNKNIILYVGRHIYIKGITILLKIAKILLIKKPEIKIVTVGDRFSFKKIPPNIISLGRISTTYLNKLYRQSLCVIFPSLWPEPMPLVPVEALASGTPVIASNVGSLNEIIIDGENGFLVKPGKISEFVNKIIELHNNTSLRNSLSKNAVEYVDKKFNIKKMIEEYVDSYNEI